MCGVRVDQVARVAHAYVVQQGGIVQVHQLRVVRHPVQILGVDQERIGHGDDMLVVCAVEALQVAIRNGSDGALLVALLRAASATASKQSPPQHRKEDKESMAGRRDECVHAGRALLRSGTQTLSPCFSGISTGTMLTGLQKVKHDFAHFEHCA